MTPSTARQTGACVLRIEGGGGTGWKGWGDGDGNNKDNNDHAQQLH